MEAASVPAPAEADPRPHQDQEAATPGDPLWMWLAVFAIVVFCLFPFYWLVNIVAEDRCRPLERRASSRPTRR